MSKTTLGESKHVAEKVGCVPPSESVLLHHAQCAPALRATAALHTSLGLPTGSSSRTTPGRVPGPQTNFQEMFAEFNQISCRIYDPCDTQCPATSTTETNGRKVLL